jgi:DNA-binding PadR family transcriptional regulator
MITDLGRAQLTELNKAWDELAEGIESIRNRHA